MKMLLLRGVACLGLVIILGAAFSADASSGKKIPVMPEGVRFEGDVAFLPADRAEKADLYLPVHAGKDLRVPAVVIIHGGGWAGGDKRANREINIGTNLAMNGYIGMSINYLLSTNGTVTWPQNLYDCKMAVRWLRVNAERLGVDPDRIGVIGGSAGGHLASMLAVTGPADQLEGPGPYEDISTRVQCAVDLYGPIDLMEYGDRAWLGKTRAEAPEVYRAASPTSYIDKNDPPILILHGTADKTVAVRQSEIFASALKKEGVEHELVIIEGAPHTFHLQPKEKDLRPLVLGFFDKHLKGITKEKLNQQR